MCKILRTHFLNSLGLKKELWNKHLTEIKEEGHAFSSDTLPKGHLEIKGKGPAKSSPTGNRTLVARVTGGNTHHYTIEETINLQFCALYTAHNVAFSMFRLFKHLLWKLVPLVRLWIVKILLTLFVPSETPKQQLLLAWLDKNNLLYVQFTGFSTLFLFSVNLLLNVIATFYYANTHLVIHFVNRLVV